MAEGAKPEPKGCLAVLLAVLSGQPPSGSGEQPLPYQSRDYLLSPAERSFFGVLHSVAGSDYFIFAKVRLADVLTIQRKTESRQSHLNRIQSKHIDFLLCDREQVRPLLVIELNDSSHQRQDRVERDAFLGRALEAAGLPLLQVPAQRAYNAHAVSGAIREKLDAGITDGSPPP